jgi:hypothetical protein
MRAGSAAGDRDGEVVATRAKSCCAIYRVVGMPAARATLDRRLLLVRRRPNPSAVPLARTVSAGAYRARLEAENLAWHATDGCSNGPTEAVNLPIKKVRRVGHGFAISILPAAAAVPLRLGWQTHRTARLRGCPPRFVAWSPFSVCDAVLQERGIIRTY